MKKEFQSGFISIIGRPNVGKSTLLNAFIGEKIAIISPKPQTTRNQVMGIALSENYQMIFMDTPGIHAPKSKLGDTMVNRAYEAMNDIDVLLYLVEPCKEILGIDLGIIERLRQKKNIPVVLVINKIDLVDKELILTTIALFSQQYDFSAVVPISALHADGLAILKVEILKYLPAGPKYFPDDMITDQPERQIVSELIREKALRFLQQEIPHGIAVAVEQMKEEDSIVRILADIYCEKDSHKSMIIGKQGAMLKKIGSAARQDIQRLLGCQVHLELWVKVKEGWRNNAALIKNFGFESKN